MRKKIIRIAKEITFNDNLEHEQLRLLWEDAFFALFWLIREKPMYNTTKFEHLAETDPTRVLMNQIVSETISENLNQLLNFRIPGLTDETDTGTLKYVLPTLSFLVPTRIRSFNPAAIEDFCFTVTLTTKPLYQVELIDEQMVKVTESVVSTENTTIKTSLSLVTIPLKPDVKIVLC